MKNVTFGMILVLQKGENVKLMKCTLVHYVAGCVGPFRSSINVVSLFVWPFPPVKVAVIIRLICWGFVRECLTRPVS